MAKKRKIKKYQFRGEGGRFIYLTKRQIVNRVKKSEFLQPTKNNKLDLTEYYEAYGNFSENIPEFTDHKKTKKQKKTETIKSTVKEAIESIDKKGKQKEKEITKRGKKRNLVKEDVSNTPCNSVPSRFADSESYAKDLIAEGKIKRFPDATYEMIRLNGEKLITKNKIEFINEYNSEVQILYDVIDLISDSEDKNKISSPQFFTSGYFFLQYGFVIVGAFINFRETEIRGCPTDLFKIYYNLYVQNL